MISKQAPHPNPLPSEGRGNWRRGAERNVCDFSELFVTLSFSHRMGEGWGEGRPI